MSVYGYCPTCGEEGVSRTRGIPSWDRCKNDHKYLATSALRQKPKKEPVCFEIVPEISWDDESQYLHGSCDDCQRCFTGHKGRYICTECDAKRIQASQEKIDARDPMIRSLLEDAIAECFKAVKKFPQPNYVLTKVAEEAGEVVKEGVHCAEGRGDVANLRNEIKQTIAMLIRLYIEGDQVHGLKAPIEHDLEEQKLLEAKKGFDHESRS